MSRKEKAENQWAVWLMFSAPNHKAGRMAGKASAAEAPWPRKGNFRAVQADPVPDATMV